ncbi:hypothetical protein XENOCAPTIV_028269 [Xenoophorus captivus]|uniref:Uncharacterized protein n=1 Tax=Xenoophorus captivus TaxID=1517983 RepID=A0ABV0QNG1_9TELE
MDFRLNASGICRIITCPTLCLVPVMFFAWDSSWMELLLWHFKIAQTEQLVCFMVMFYYRLDVWISGCTAREVDGLIDGYFFRPIIRHSSNVLHSNSPFCLLSRVIMTPS